MSSRTVNFVLAPTLDQLASWTLEHRPTETQMWTVEQALVDTLAEQVGSLRVYHRHLVVGEGLCLHVCSNDNPTGPVDLHWEGVISLRVAATGAWVRASLLAFYDNTRVGPTEYGQATYQFELVERDGHFGWQASGWLCDAHKEYFDVTSPTAPPHGSKVETTYG
ncbi:hypothetical protein DB30_01323 [Enhygromyxa salina]|uniref:Uncharacterized protein n=1 Tax=Enhygromyxa salina TaxID=215803 RepID=A0A0C2CMM0_9BACT|nr:hypothetical protein [Enhygromyxa salina]KIG12506.1 hypothetical protein DB30_01323 [Enhygromyxa salina]